MARQGTRRLAKAILETADGMHRTGIMDRDVHAKNTMRHLRGPSGAAEPISGEEAAQVANAPRESRSFCD